MTDIHAINFEEDPKPKSWLSRLWDWLSYNLWYKPWNWTPLYWLRSHTFTKYHIVDCRAPQHGYAWGWMDRSMLVLYANMNILVNFVEEENGLDGIVDWEADPVHSKAAKQLREIYTWWKTGRKQEHDAHHDFLMQQVLPAQEKCKMDKNHGLWPRDDDSPEYQAYASLNKQWLEEGTALDRKDRLMLLKLIRLKDFLWT